MNDKPERLEQDSENPDVRALVRAALDSNPVSSLGATNVNDDELYEYLALYSEDF